MSKKLGSYHSKVAFLSLQNPVLDSKSAKEDFFEGLKNAFLSDKTPIFLTLSDHKGIIYTWKKIVLESDHYKWSKMAIEVGRFSRRHRKFGGKANRGLPYHSGVLRVCN